MKNILQYAMEVVEKKFLVIKKRVLRSVGVKLA